MVFIFYSDEIAIDVKTGLVLDTRTNFFSIILLLACYNIIILYAFD
jgi:hypothetical protein